MLGSVARLRLGIRFSSAPRRPSWARSRSPMRCPSAWCSCAPSRVATGERLCAFTPGSFRTSLAWSSRTHRSCWPPFRACAGLTPPAQALRWPSSSPRSSLPTCNNAWRHGCASRSRPDGVTASGSGLPERENRPEGRPVLLLSAARFRNLSALLCVGALPLKPSFRSTGVGGEPSDGRAVRTLLYAERRGRSNGLSGDGSSRSDLAPRRLSTATKPRRAPRRRRAAPTEASAARSLRARPRSTHGPSAANPAEPDAGRDEGRPKRATRSS
jgi:hypothetical protein